MTPTKVVIVALTGTRILFSLLVSELDFQGTSLTWPGPMEFFRFCKNCIIKISYTMPIAIAKINFISWNMGINDNSFSIVNPAQDEAPEGIPKYNDAKYPNKLEYNFDRSYGICHKCAMQAGYTEKIQHITYLMVHTNVRWYKPRYLAHSIFSCLWLHC